MPYKEKEIEKKYFTIGEVARSLKVATSLIRFWESEFDIIKPKKKSERKPSVYSGRHKKHKAHIPSC